MNKFLKKSWQTMIINGIVAILLGVLFMFTQDDAINLIIKWAGIIFVIAGVTLICVDIYYAIKKKLWGTFMFFGALLLVVGIIFALFPEAVRNVLLVIIGIWVVLTGIFQIIATIKFRKRFPQYVMNIINGALMVIIGVVFIFRPELSAKFLTYLISACLIVIGCWELFNAFRFKKVIKEALKADDIEDAEVEE